MSGDWDQFDGFEDCLKVNPDTRIRKSSHLMRHVRRGRLGYPPRLKTAAELRKIQANNSTVRRQVPVNLAPTRKD